MKKFKYKSLFSSQVRVVVGEEKDRYLSQASLVEVREFLPNVKDYNTDLLPVAFSSFVANRVNKNGDAVDTKRALELHEKFINKQINIEHNRKSIVGFITNVGFSEFGTDKPISVEKVKEMAKANDLTPFNVVLGGLVWKVASSELVDLLQESNDPSSGSFLKVSASWEVGFSDFEIVVLEAGEKNLENAEFIKDEEKIFEISHNLRGFGGDGTYEGKDIHRLIVGENILPLGIGLTESPAADVEGVAVKMQGLENKTMASAPKEESQNLGEKVEGEDETVEDVKIEASTPKTTENAEKTKDSVKNIEQMKIVSDSDITNERLKDGTITSEVLASWSRELVSEKLREASNEYTENKEKSEKALSDAQATYDQLVKESKATQEELAKTQETLKETAGTLAAILHSEKVTERLNVIAAKFDLSEDQEKAISSKIADISTEDDEAFAKYVEDLKLFIGEKKVEKPETVKASAETVKDAVDNGVVDNTSIASSSTDSTPKYTEFKLGENVFIK